VASEEALGQPTLLLVVGPAGIPSEEALGDAAIVLGGVTLLPMGIVTAEQLGAVRVIANLIASEAQLVGSKRTEVGLLGDRAAEVALGGKT
jgi:hypothetical protein